MGCAATKIEPKQQISALFQAIKFERYHEATQLISKGRISFNCRNFNGRTPLIEACRTRNQSQSEEELETFVEFLLENGGDWRRCDIYGKTAIMYAEYFGHDRVAEILDRKERKLSAIENRESPNMVVINVFVRKQSLISSLQKMCPGLDKANKKRNVTS